MLSIISYVLALENRQQKLSELQEARIQPLTIFSKGTEFRRPDCCLCSVIIITKKAIVSEAISKAVQMSYLGPLYVASVTDTRLHQQLD